MKTTKKISLTSISNQALKTTALKKLIGGDIVIVADELAYRGIDKKDIRRG